MMHIRLFEGKNKGVK